MNNRIGQIVFSIGFLLVGSVASAQKWDAKYCVPVDKIDYNPFREIRDGKELAYLVLLRSYISTDESESGLLESYEFSPDGKIFTGKKNSNLKWDDGSDVTPFELAMGIAKGIRYRTLGQRVSVVGTENIESANWESQSYSGVEILDKNTFRLKFAGEIKNMTGVIREALSTNSRHNRLWPIKLDKGRVSGREAVLGKFPMLWTDDGPAFKGNQTKVLVANAKQCPSSDFSIFPEYLNLESEKFNFHKSPSPSAIFFQANTELLNLKERSSLIRWLRQAFSGLPESTGVVSVESFFLIGEPGFNPKVKWPKSANEQTLKGRKIKVGYEIPIFKAVLSKAAHESGIELELVSLPSDRTDLDGQVLASGMNAGRHLILQDALEWKNVKEYVKNDPKTRKSLQLIAKLSASTIPPDLKTLQEFESNALSGQSVAPLARRYPIAFSKQKMPVCLRFTNKGEITFAAEAICRQ